MNTGMSTILVIVSALGMFNTPTAKSPPVKDCNTEFLMLRYGILKGSPRNLIFNPS
jgi:hypothetical protein